MHDPAAEELELALKRFCDEVLSDITIPTAEGLARRVHWRYRGREFRATVPVLAALTDGTYAAWRRHGQHFSYLPSPPTFEAWEAGAGWEDVLSVGIWRWMLRSAGRRRGGDDERPGGLTGRPVRPLPNPPGLIAGAEAIPDVAPRETHRQRTLRLAHR